MGTLATDYNGRSKPHYHCILQHGPPDRVNLLASAPPGSQNGEKEGAAPQENRPDDRQLMPPPPTPPGVLKSLVSGCAAERVTAILSRTVGEGTQNPYPPPFIQTNVMWCGPDAEKRPCFVLLFVEK